MSRPRDNGGYASSPRPVDARLTWRGLPGCHRAGGEQARRAPVPRGCRLVGGETRLGPRQQARPARHPAHPLPGAERTLARPMRGEVTRAVRAGAERAPPRRPGCRKDTCSPQAHCSPTQSTRGINSTARLQRAHRGTKTRKQLWYFRGKYLLKGVALLMPKSTPPSWTRSRLLDREDQPAPFTLRALGATQRVVPPTKLVLLFFLPCVPGN